MSGDTEIAWLPVAEIEHPKRPGTYDVLVDAWWVIDTEGNAAVWKSGKHISPIANTDRSIVERVGMPHAIRATDLSVATMKIRCGHIPHHCEDY